jgi:two-component system CheB/CheR fusion protein
VISVPLLPSLKVIPFQIQQLFNNLISNSIKYSREDVAPEIRIETAEVSKEEIDEIEVDPKINYVKIIIEDNGIGFDEEFAARIFDPFYRLHNTGQYAGSGLGLTLVKKIIDNHHGMIKASSKINSGTKISIYIPI